MRLNAQFPTRFIGNDPAKIRDWAQAAEALGFDTIEVPDHVFGAAARGDWKPTYDEREHFHETFVTLGFLAACTSTIKLSTGVLVMPQRQTGVVAKQAAEADLLSGGRLRLGIGVGWNHVEYEALGENWKTRGAKQAEQVEVLRMLWTEETGDLQRQIHELDQVNVVPGPKQRPIPDLVRRLIRSRYEARRPARRRLDADHAARRKAVERVETVRGHLKDFGRAPNTFGLEAWLRTDSYDPESWGKGVEKWREIGMDQVMLYPMFDIGDVTRQIEILESFKAAAS